MKILLIALFTGTTLLGSNDIIRARDTSVPLFVPLPAAVDSNGRVQWDAFGVVRQVIKSKIEHPSIQDLADPATPCPVLIMSVCELGARPSHTWRDLVLNAEGVLSGRITAVTPGFYLATPATLLDIDVTDTIDLSGQFENLRTIRTIHDHVDFVMAGVRFCNVGRSGFVPRAGDQIAVFAYGPAVDREGTFIPTGPQMLFFGRDSRVYSDVGAALTDEGRVPTFAELWRRIRSDTAPLPNADRNREQ